MASSNLSAGSDIFVLSLEMQPFLDEQFSTFFKKLSESAQSNQLRLKRAKTIDGAIRYLKENQPRVIIATDHGLSLGVNRAVFQQVKSYVNRGGLVIFGLHFSGFVTLDEFASFWKDGFGLNWKRGDYHRTSFKFNPSCALPQSANRSLLSQSQTDYSAKAVHIKGALAKQKIWIPCDDAMTQSLVFTPSYVDQSQASVVGGRVGEGYIVYIGDVNGEEETDMTILALAGLI